jgi:hypothetical protein
LLENQGIPPHLISNPQFMEQLQISKSQYYQSMMQLGLTSENGNPSQMMLDHLEDSLKLAKESS